MHNGELKCGNILEGCLTREYNGRVKRPCKSGLFYNEGADVSRVQQAWWRSPRQYKCEQPWHVCRCVGSPPPYDRAVCCHSHCSMPSCDFFKNIHISYEKVETENFLYTNGGCACPVDTPHSVAGEEISCPKSRFAEDFFTDSSCAQTIFRAVAMRLGGCSASQRLKFRRMASFHPRTLLLGYVLFSKAATGLALSLSEIPRLFLVCCIAASKTQYDGHVSNESFAGEDLEVEEINYLEGLVLNRLQYEMRIGEDEVCLAIEEISRMEYSQHAQCAHI